jgi:hypothetical protein
VPTDEACALRILDALAVEQRPTGPHFGPASDDPTSRGSAPPLRQAQHSWEQDSQTPLDTGAALPN